VHGKGDTSRSSGVRILDGFTGIEGTSSIRNLNNDRRLGLLAASITALQVEDEVQFTAGIA